MQQTKTEKSVIFQIRPMLSTDLLEVLTIEQTLFPDDAWTEAAFLSELQQTGMGGSRTYLVGTLRKRPLVTPEIATIVGYGGIMMAADVADITTLAVAPKQQGRGFGKELFFSLLTEAIARGVREFYLDVRADNPNAIALYQASGFEEVTRRRNYYPPGVQSTEAVDAIVMRADASDLPPHLQPIPSGSAPNPKLNSKG